jgi:hypothetical protein
MAAGSPSSGPARRPAAQCGVCRRSRQSTEESPCLWCAWDIEVVRNPHVDQAAQRYASSEPSWSHRQRIIAYFTAQRTLPMLGFRSPSHSKQAAEVMEQLRSPEGQAEILCVVKHAPGTLVVRPTQAVIVSETVAWRRTLGRTPDERRLWTLRDCLLSSPAIE